MVKGAQRLLTGDLLVGVPAALQLTGTGHTGDTGIQAVEGVNHLHRRVRAADNDAALIQNGAPGVGRLNTLRAQAVLRHGPVEVAWVNCIAVGMPSPGPVNILRGNDLEVLNAQAGVLLGFSFSRRS